MLSPTPSAAAPQPLCCPLARFVSVVLAAALALAVALLPSSCARGPDPCEGQPRVVVTIPPLEGLVRELMPANPPVRSLIPPGRSEHGYEFTPQDMADLAAAEVVIYVGLGLEPKVERFLEQNPSPTRTVICFADVAGIADPGDHEHHHHEEGEECDHGPVDPHLWLDPVLVRKLVPSITAAIDGALRRRGTYNETIGANLNQRSQALLARIDALDAELRETLKPARGAPIVTHHNAWQRLADRYGLEIAAVIREVNHSDPTPDAIARSVEAIRSRGVRGIFVEPQFNPDAAQRIAAAAGVTVGSIDPLGDADWFGMMRGNAKSIVATLGPVATADKQP